MIERLIRSASAVLAATLPLALGACGRVPGQFEILSDQVPSTGTCTVPLDAAMYRGKGTLDVSVVRGGFDSAYLLFPLMQNNLPRPATGTLDPNRIQLSGFDVDITPQDPGSLAPSIAAVFQAAAGTPLVHYQTAWAGDLSSGGGQATATVSAFPVALAQNLAAAGGLGTGAAALTVNLHVQARGTTTNGTSMQSDPFDFPLEICSGCLVASAGPCPLMNAPANLGNSCNPAQDQLVDCCTENGALVCPATTAATP